MLEKKIITIDDVLIHRKCAVRQRNLEDYSYYQQLQKVDQHADNGWSKPAQLVGKTMLGFFGGVDAVAQRLGEELPHRDSVASGAVWNYALHLSALYHREQLLPTIGKEPLLRTPLRMEVDPQHYSLIIPALIKYNLTLLENNRRTSLPLVQEFFFSRIIDATYRNGQHFTIFNEALGHCAISFKNGTVRTYEGYTHLEAAVHASVQSDVSSLKIKERVPKMAKALSLSDEGAIPAVGKPRSPVLFKDIAGYHELKNQLQDLAQVLTKNDVYKKAGVPLPTGYLLYGPPGTGKTTVVYAFANECGWPFHELNVQDVLDKYVGESEHKIAEFLRRKGILLLDEFDSLGRKKDNLSGDSTYAINITNVIATELGKYDPERILFATTNNLDLIDTKLKSRRLGNVILVDYPDEKDCQDIIHLKLLTAEQQSEGYKYTPVDYNRIAKAMQEQATQFQQQYHVHVGFSGADIENILYDCLRVKSRRMLHGQPMEPPTTEDYITMVQHFDFAARQT